MNGRRRVGVLVEVPEVLRELGKDPAAVIAASGIDAAILRDPDSSISFAELDKLLDVCSAMTNCPHFGLLVGQRTVPASLGMIGRLMQNAPTLGVALKDLCTNQKYYTQGAVAYLAVQGETAFWGYAVYFPAMQARDQLTDGAVAAGMSLFRALVDTSPDAVLSTRRAPIVMEPYRRFYGVTPQFECEQDAIVFPARLLDLKVQGADPAARRLLEQVTARNWADREPSIKEQAIRILRAGVIFDRASLNDVAAELQMHPRTLNRRLEAEGTSFRKLVNTARFEVARQLLGGTRMPVTDIALVLGYADSSAFNHAFRRSTGAAPSEWRKQPMWVE